MKKMLLWAILPGILLSMLFAGCSATTSEMKDFSWYGESGAEREPVYDEVKEGHWWIPAEAPAGQENELWGNRGYVFVAEQKPAPEPPPPPAPKVIIQEKVVEKIVEKPVEKIVYVDKPVEKIVYVDKPVEKIVYKDKIVEKVKYSFLNLKDVFFPYDSAQLTALALETLKDNADVLKAHPDVNVVLIGSASPEGASEYNQKLSERRVDAVKNQLVSKEGIAADRLKTEAKGEKEVARPSWPFARKVGFLVAE
ncbi:MAG: OmpA family protein [Candidatus Omnitrophica bacterium]|nr:OmpA family protein [Candidatus Omnitrophota bacterium]